MSDRVVWTDGQYSDVLYSKTTKRHHRGRLVVGLFPLDVIVALQDAGSQLTPTGVDPTAIYIYTDIGNDICNDVVTCEINYFEIIFEIISMFYFTCNYV